LVNWIFITNASDWLIGYNKRNWLVNWIFITNASDWLIGYL
jgi:hypothetical protein